MSRMRVPDWGLLLALAVLWGGVFVLAKIAVAELPPLTVVLGRVGLGALALHVALLATGQRLPGGLRSAAAFGVLGLLNNLVPFGLIFWAQTVIPSGLAAILNGTSPLFAIVIGHAVTGQERITPARLGGLVVGLAGVAVTIGPDAVRGFSGHLVAQLACLVAALSYAVAGSFARRRFAGVPPMATAAGQLTATTLLAIPAVALVDQPWRLAPPGLRTIAAIAGLALLGTALAFIIYFRLVATVGATNALLVTLLVPVAALALGALVLGEWLGPRHFAGMALIGAGLAAVDGRALDWLRWRGTAPAGRAGAAPR